MLNSQQMSPIEFLAKLETAIPPPDGVHHNITVSGLTIFHHGLWFTFSLLDNDLSEARIQSILEFFASQAGE